MKRYFSFVLYILLIAIISTGCGDTGGPTGPTTAAPNLSNVSTSATPPLGNGVHRGELLILYIEFVDLSGDLNGGSAVVTDDQNYHYENLFVSNAEGTSGTLTITITVNNLLASGQEHLFTIVVFDRAGNQSNTVYATVNIL